MTDSKEEMMKEEMMSDFFFIVAIAIFLIIIATITLKSCSESYTEESPPYKLRRIVERQGGEISGFFILGSGSIDGRLYQKIAFSAEIEPNTYKMFEFPLESLTIRIDNKVKIPTVTFVYRKHKMLIKEFSVAPVITCADYHWSADTRVRILE